MIRMELFKLDANAGGKILLQTQKNVLTNVLFEGEGKLKN